MSKYAIETILVEPLTGIEPVTPSLPWKCSTTELQRLMKHAQNVGLG